MRPALSRYHRGIVGGLATVSQAVTGHFVAAFIPAGDDGEPANDAAVSRLANSDREIAMALADALAQDEGHVCADCPPWPE